MARGGCFVFDSVVGARHGVPLQEEPIVAYDFAMSEAAFIHRCLSLAREGQGKVGNGAMVGAVLVRDGRITAEAFHEGFGKPHAERSLLENFKERIEPSDILYVNLEPCCHHGKTPPCTDIIIERGVKRVIIGMQDPDASVAGKGIAALRATGISVEGPIERASAEYLNRGFFSVRTKGRPFVTIHRAQTRDGQIAKPDGSPLKITSEEQDKWNHQFLRARHDAIVVGVETIVRDDPRLTVRYNEASWQPLRIILDPRLRIPRDAHVVSDAEKDRTIIVTSVLAAEARDLREKGVNVITVPSEKGVFHWPALWTALTTPRESFHGITSVLVEGGRRTWEIFEDAGMVDEEVMLVGV